MGSLFHSVRESGLFFIQHAGFSRAPWSSCWRVAAWYAHLALRKTPRVRIDAWDAEYILPRAARGPAKVFYVFREDYEPELRFFAERLKPGDAFVDVGANFGLFAVLASRRVGSSGKVHAFEPWRPSAANLRQNVKLNDCGNVVIHECALSDRSGRAQFSVHEDCGRNSLGRLENAANAEVEVQKLDVVLGDGAIVDWMKIDVEGAEELVFRGAGETLQRCLPAIVFEITRDGPLRLGLEPFGAWACLSALGYEFFDVDDPGLRPLTEPRLGNSLAVHPRSGRGLADR
jgi:FkbM family methyltransferase